jgi:PKD repeat protein
LPPPPVASFTAVPTSGVAPLPVLFTDTSTGDISTRSWDFNGDGTADATGPTASHTFDSPGTYQAALTVTGIGGTNTMTQTITVNVPPPVASFTAAPTTGTASLAVQLASTSTGNITSMTWNDGNGSTFVFNNPPFVPVQVTYDTPGTYTVTLTVNGPGGSDTASKEITVTAPNAAPSVMISSPESGASFQALTNVTFTGSAMDAEDGNISQNIAWSSNINGSIGTGSSFSKGNLSPGQHTITASVSDIGGKTASKSITVTITPLPPPTLPDPPECGGRRCEPRDPGDGPPDRL